MANMSQLSISISIKESVEKSVTADDINENLTDSTYFYMLDDYDDCKNDIPSDLQKLIEKENAPACKIIEETFIINLGNENNP